MSFFKNCIKCARSKYVVFEDVFGRSKYVVLVSGVRRRGNRYTKYVDNNNTYGFLFLKTTYVERGLFYLNLPHF